jgi:hypothetical protein
MRNSKNNSEVKNAKVKNAQIENIVELTKEQIAEATKERLRQKRQLNPQFAHVVSKQRKLDKLNPYSIFLNTKTIVKNIEIEGYSYAENLNAIEEAIKFINFVTQLDKDKNVKNKELFDFVIENVRVSKTGQYSEYFFAQLVQKIVTTTIKRKCNYKEAMNFILASKK